MFLDGCGLYRRYHDVSAGQRNRTCTEEMLDFYLTISNDLKPNTKPLCPISSTMKCIMLQVERLMWGAVWGIVTGVAGRVGSLYRKAGSHITTITAFAKYKLKRSV